MQQPTIAPAPPDLQIQTLRFGEPEQVTVSPANLYTFPEPVPGLADSHRFALVEDAAYGPLKWLQSLDEAAVCLPVLPAASLAVPGYGAEVAAFLGAAPDAEVGVLLVTRFDAEASSFAVNLLAPIVLDGRSGTGRQVILEDRSHPIRQHIVWDAAAEVFALC
jgi:flagellar assembly factor FliW